MGFEWMGSFLYILYQAFLVTVDDGEASRCKIVWVASGIVIEDTGYDYFSYLEAEIAVFLSPYSQKPGHRGLIECYSDKDFA